jgi:hypothetical protein
MQLTSAIEAEMETTSTGHMVAARDKFDDYLTGALATR